MRNGIILLITALVIFVGSYQDSQGGEDILKKFHKMVPEEAITNAKQFKTNGFNVQSFHAKEIGEQLNQTGREMDMLFVTADRLFKVSIEKGRESSGSGGVGIYHRKSGTPMLSAGDKDGDGQFDVLSYSAVDNNGTATLTVIDYDVDGQPDIRVHLKDGYSEIWHNDRWYRIESRGNNKGIVIDGKFVELQKRDNRWLVP